MGEDRGLSKKGKMRVNYGKLVRINDSAAEALEQYKGSGKTATKRILGMQEEVRKLRKIAGDLPERPYYGSLDDLGRMLRTIMKVEGVSVNREQMEALMARVDERLQERNDELVKKLDEMFPEEVVEDMMKETVEERKRVIIEPGGKA